MKKILFVCFIMFSALLFGRNYVKAVDEAINSSLIVTSETGEDVTGKYKIENVEGTRVVKTTILESGNYYIKGTNPDEVSEKIEVVGGINAKIIIDNVKLFYNSTKAGSPIYINPTSNVELALKNENSIRAPQYYPAIGFYASETPGTLTISGIDGGSLYALGGGGEASGIGGSSKFASDPNSSRNSGDIVINSGNIQVDSGGKGGAAIGSASPYGIINNITINGGNINATAGYSPMSGAAIGSGADSTVNNIVINGGHISASTAYRYGKNSDSAAIGSGGYGSVKNITINGGIIETSTDFGVGIGGSNGSKQIDKIEINGGTITTNSTTSKIENTIGMSDGSIHKVSRIEVNGGSIKTKAFSESIRNKDDEELLLLKLDDIKTVDSLIVDSNNVNIDGLHKDDSSLYLYVAKKDHSVVITSNGEKKEYDVSYHNDTNSFTVTVDSGSLPWEDINEVPSITANDIEIKIGTEFNQEIAKKYATAYDKEDRDLTDRIQVISYDVNPNIVGNYSITYSVSDLKGASVNKTIRVIVYADLSVINNAPSLTGDNKTFEEDINITRELLLEGIEANDYEDGILTDSIEIVNNDIVQNKPGTYHVTYKVTDKGNVSTFLTIEVKIVEKVLPSKPVINANDITINLNDKFDDVIAKKDVTAYDGEGNDITNKIEIVENNVDPKKPGNYYITFEVSDNYGQSVRKTITVTVVDNAIAPNNNNSLIITLTVVLTVVVIGSTVLVVYYYKKKNRK